MDDDHYFGFKRTDPSMKTANMETDCGGIITCADMTYGDADALAATVDIFAVKEYIRKRRCGFMKLRTFPSCYWKLENGKAFIGEMWWVIYSYLADKKLIKGDPSSYSNSKEYLYDLILKRMEEAKLVTADSERRWYELNE